MFVSRSGPWTSCASGTSPRPRSPPHRRGWDHGRRSLEVARARLGSVAAARRGDRRRPRGARCRDVVFGAARRARAARAERDAPRPALDRARGDVLVPAQPVRHTADVRDRPRRRRRVGMHGRSVHHAGLAERGARGARQPRRDLRRGSQRGGRARLRAALARGRSAALRPREPVRHEQRGAGHCGRRRHRRGAARSAVGLVCSRAGDPGAGHRRRRLVDRPRDRTGGAGGCAAREGCGARVRAHRRDLVSPAAADRRGSWTRPSRTPWRSP